MTEIASTPNLIGSGIEKFSSINLSETESKQSDLEAKLKSVGKEFEGVFLSLILKEMRNTLEGGGFFGEETSDTYGGMFDMFIGQDLAESSPLGIAELLTDNLAKFEAGGKASELTDIVKSAVASVRYLNAADIDGQGTINSFTV
jgi:flagellar protein FlgJ